MIKQLFLGFVGLSGGVVIAGGVIALLVGLEIITRFVGIAHCAKHVRLFEDAVTLGTIFGTCMTVYKPPFLLQWPGLLLMGFFFGMFVGGWILALAEIVNIFPILTRRVGLTKGLSFVIIALALGKTTGSFLHFYMRW